MTADPQLLNDPWLYLKEGDRVQIQTGGQISAGTVDCVTPDASIFWIWLDAGGGRKAIYCDPDVTVDVLPAVDAVDH